MRLILCLALLLCASMSALAQTTDPAPYVPPPGPSCLPALDLHNVKTMISGNNVQTVIWCPIAGAQIAWWSFGGTLDEALSPTCVAALFGQGGPAKVLGQQDLAANAWTACMDRQQDSTGKALALQLVYQWVPRVTVTAGASTVYTVDKNGRIYPYIVNNVVQTVTMANVKGAGCGGKAYNDSKGHYYYTMVGMTTDQGLKLLAPATPTDNRLDYAAPCVTTYPPAGGWTT